MYQKLPYYMAYPIQTEYDERAERTDLEYMKSLYPDLPKRILPYVEEECDRMEYTGSVMFDVYPDKLQLRIMCSRICENVKKQEKMFAGEERMLRVKRSGGSFVISGNLPTQGRTEKKETKNLQLLFIARKIYDIIIQITTKETDSEEGNGYK